MTAGRPIEFPIAPEAHNAVRFASAVERFGIAGPGLFMRNNLESWYPASDIIGTFTWCCVPFVNSSRGRPNRRTQYLTDLVANCVTVTGFDWLPRPNTWERGLDDAINYTADVGGRGFVLDAEREFRVSVSHNAASEAQRYVDRAHELCRRRNLWLGFSSFGSTGLDLPWNIFLEGSDLAIPQTYDRYHQLQPNYVSDSVRGYWNRGARVFSFGSGAYRGLQANQPVPEGAPLQPGGWRWRTAGELDEHLRLFPSYARSIIAWPIAGRLPQHVRQAYRDWWRRL